jgi:hypothetical protein
LDVKNKNDDFTYHYKNRLLILKHLDSYKYTVGNRESDIRNLPNYEYLKSLIYLYKDCYKKMDILKRNINNIYPNIDKNDLTRSDNFNKIKNKNKNIFKNINSRLFTYNPQNIFSSTAKSIRKYHSSNYSFVLDDNYIDNLIKNPMVPIFDKKN